MFSARPKAKTKYGGSLLPDYTRRCGYDTIRLNLDLGSDATVFPMPSEHLWYGEYPLPLPKSDDPCQLSMQLKCLEVDAYGGGTFNLKNGVRGLWRRQEGVFFKLTRSPYRDLLAIEASLPKLLFGHNKSPLPLDMLPEALDDLTRRARGFLGVNLPHVSELEAWRIDATADVELRSELEVGLVARVLADRPLNNVLATRYPTGGSLKWSYPKSRNLATVRCYGKSAESEDAKIAGRYRSEVQCMGGRQFRGQLEKMVADGQLDPKWLSKGGQTCVKAECLADEKMLCSGLLGVLNGVLDGAIDYVREVGSVTALEAIDLLETKAGVRRDRAVQLVGYSHIVRVLGWGFTGLARKGVWEAKKAFEAAGVDPASIEFSTAEKIGAGAGMVVGGAVLGATAIAGAVLGSVIADKLVPDAPSPKRFAEPGPALADDLQAA